MRIGSRGLGRFVLLGVEQGADSARALFPLAARVRVEDIRERAPSAVASERSLFVLGRGPAFLLNELEGPDSLDIVTGLFFQPALPDTMGIDYAEVPPRRRRDFRLDVCDCDGGDGFFDDELSDAANAHSSIASSQAAW